MSSTSFIQHSEIKIKSNVSWADLFSLNVFPFFLLLFSSCGFVCPMISSGNFISVWSALDCADYQTNDIRISYHCNTFILASENFEWHRKAVCYQFCKIHICQIAKIHFRDKKSINILICYLSLSVTHVFTQMITFQKWKLLLMLKYFPENILHLLTLLK